MKAKLKLECVTRQGFITNVYIPCEVDDPNAIGGIRSIVSREIIADEPKKKVTKESEKT